jgi:hypothetical protein
MKNNLFNFATSELSQDAFICWILNFAHKDHLYEDSALTECAKELIGIFVKTKENFMVTNLIKQYMNIDVFVEVNNKYNIIIEDKIYTSKHNDQINTYKTALEKEGKSNIICVYYKTIEQFDDEKDADVYINRDVLIEIFSKYFDKTSNNIFLDYYYKLQSISDEVNSYKVNKITNWSGNAYRGFFAHLIKDNITDRDVYGWDYVPNSAGGFWGLWWYFLENDELNKQNLTEKHIDSLYLQIENDIITVKMAAGVEDPQDVRWSLFKYFESIIPGFKKKTFKKGTTMTIGYVEYNETNYIEKIKLMENAMQSVVDGAYKYVPK